MDYLYCGDWCFTGDIAGINSFGYDPVNNCVEDLGIQGDDPGQSIIAIAGRTLVSVCELNKGGYVVSYIIEDDGKLTKVSRLPFESFKLSYVVASPNGKYVFVSSMGDGTVKMIRINEDSSLALTDEWKLSGHSVTKRQSTAKVHSCMISPDGTLLAAANLGADEVDLFRVDYERETIRMISSAIIDWGKEPRHMAFHPSGKLLYVLTESGNRIYAFRVNCDSLKEIAVYNTLNPKQEEKGAAADILVSRNGKFLYSTNRGQNNIAVWKIDEESGLLNIIGWYECGGKGPRGIHFSPDGNRLYCANNDSADVTVLELDTETGIPGKVLALMQVPGAGCVRAYEAVR